MKELALNTKNTMTLKEITDLLEVRHNDAMATVAKMSESKSFGDVTRISYRTKQGNEYETYSLDRRQSLAVSAKLNTELLMRVIDRWQELEEKEHQRAVDKQKRQELRVEFRPMTDAIVDSRQGKEIKPWHFSNEADLINRIALGCSAAKFKAMHEIEKNEALRDYLTIEQKNALISLQRANTVFLQLGMSFEDRKTQLTKLYDKQHKEKLIAEIIKLAA